MKKKTRLNEGDLLAMPFGSVAEIRRLLVEVADSGFVCFKPLYVWTPFSHP